ncbi:MAG TPA: SDR family oxidoreductase [Naasia sp.]
MAADLASDEGAAKVEQNFPDADILVNNLGIYHASDVSTESDAEWLRMFELNVLSSVRVTRRFFPGMIERNWGRVLMIASDAAVAVPPDMIPYAVSKTALLSLSRGLAKVAAGTGVTVNSLIVGPTNSEGLRAFVAQTVGSDLPWEEAQREFMRRSRPLSILGRVIEPREVANMVAYLSSDLASATTGGALRVDGGYVDSIVP